MSDMKTIFEAAKSIAVVGLSHKPERDSNMVAAYMQNAGYHIIPVRPPGGEKILGETSYASLGEVPGPIDIVDIFRRSEFVMEIVKEAIALDPKPRAIWMQFGVEDADAKALAEEHGVTVFMNHCLKVDHASAIG